MSGDASEIERRLRKFIVEELLEEGLYEGGDPLATDAVDSLGLEQLVGYIEEAFGVRIGDSEIAERNFESTERLALFVKAKQEAMA